MTKGDAVPFTSALGKFVGDRGRNGAPIADFRQHVADLGIGNREKFERAMSRAGFMSAIDDQRHYADQLLGAPTGEDPHPCRVFAPAPCGVEPFVRQKGRPGCVPVIQGGPRGLEPREAVGVGDQANFHGMSTVAAAGEVSCVGSVCYVSGTNLPRWSRTQACNSCKVLPSGRRCEPFVAFAQYPGPRKVASVAGAAHYFVPSMPAHINKADL